jgi:hypothetical protein
VSPNELISAVEILGGSLNIDGDLIHAELTPEAKELLLPELKANRDAVYAALVERAREDSGNPAAVEAEVACRCSKWSFLHVHGHEDRQKAIREWNRDLRHKWIQ